MKFWDASAIVPLLVAEGSTRWLQALGETDPTMLVWLGSPIECVSALARLERDGALSTRRRFTVGAEDFPKVNERMQARGCRSFFFRWAVFLTPSANSWYSFASPLGSPPP